MTRTRAPESELDADATSPTLAAIDVGSNSIKMTVARREPDGRIHDLVWRADVVRLGAGIDQTGRLADDRVEAAMVTLGRFASEARALGAARLLAVATEATRAAANGPDFLERVRRDLGIEVLVIDGDREAELSFRGLAASIDVSGRVLVADIGGGSTELISANEGEIAATGSVPLGSGRLTDLLVASDPPLAGELAACRLRAREIAQPLHDRLSAGSPAGVRLVLVGGTGEYLGRMVPDAGQIVPGDVEAVLGRMQATRASDLATALAIPEARARVLPAGVAIVAALIELVAPATILVAQSGIRAGLLMEAFAAIEPVTEASPR